MVDEDRAPPAERPEAGDGELFVSSFARGLRVIRSFSDVYETQTLAEIARRADVSRATARRLVHTLIELGYARARGRNFALTAKVLDLGYSYLSSTSLWSMAQPYMEEVVARTGASCSIGVLDGNDIIYVARVSPRQLMRRVVSIGSRVPAHAVAMGRIQLSQLDEGSLRDRVAGLELEAFTARTITDRPELIAAIGRDGGRGWSIVDREFDEGISGIAMAIRGRENKVIAAANLSLRPEQIAQDEVMENLRRELSALIWQIEQFSRSHQT